MVIFDRLADVELVFSTARALRSLSSAEGFPPLFDWFTGTTVSNCFDATLLAQS
jgi:hypothetical protein